MTSISGPKVEIKEDNDDEYEEVTMIVDLKGVLDGSTVMRAMGQKNIGLRFANTERPLVQIGSSMFTGEWSKPLGTDLIYKGTTLSLPTEDKGNEKEYEFVSCSCERLSTSKAIMSKNGEA